MDHKPSHRLILIGAALILVHAVLLFFVLPELSGRLTTSVNQEVYADGYDLLATNLISGHGYRFYPDTAETLMREPGYPLLLAGLFALFGQAFVAVKLVNMLLAFGTVFFIGLLAGGFESDDGRSLNVPLLLASTLFLFHPGILIAESRAGVEIPFAFLTALFIWSLSRAMEQQGWVRYATTGLILGVTVLVRSTLLLFPFLVLAYLLAFRRKEISGLKALRNMAALVFAMGAVMSPWIVRNFRLTGKFVPTASVFGVSAQAGEYMNEHLFEGRPLWLLDREAARKRDQLAIAAGMPFEDGPQGYYQTFYRTDDELRFSKMLGDMTVAKYKAQPLLFLRCVAQNLFNFWFAGKTWSIVAFNLIVQLPYIGFALVGISRKFKTHSVRPLIPALLLMCYVMLLHAPIIAQARYSMPLIPFVSIFAATGVLAVFGDRFASAKTLAVSSVEA